LFAFGVFTKVRILILQEGPAPAKALQQSLGGRHELVFAKTIPQAMSALAEQSIDLIIARVHLEKSNVFDFLKDVKATERYRQIPFICFCGRRTSSARALDPIISRSSKALGAEKYINVEDYCCGEQCDFDKLRIAIENCSSTA
jgi:CheY-like chemotaxis protein